MHQGSRDREAFSMLRLCGIEPSQMRRRCRKMVKRRSRIACGHTGEVAIATEVELKLSARPADLPQLKRALVEMAPGSASSQERLISTYYDTQDLALKQRGLTLRIREHAGRFIQTVKAGDLARANILARGEWEDALSDNRPDLEAPHSGAHLPEDVAGEFRPVFVTDVARTAVEIEPVPGTHIEAAIDKGEIRVVGGDAVEPISEIELELKSGETAGLYDLALRLLDVAPIRIETRSKSERGYRLAEGDEAAPPVFHAEPIALDPDMTVEAALQKIGRSCLAQLLRNEAAVLAAQPEGVHQMRVAVRRIRSAVSSLKEVLPSADRRWVAEELGWLGDALGPARNLDVFTSELLPAARARLPDDLGWDDLAAILDRLRRAAYDRVREEILSERYTATMLRLSRWFEVGGWRAHPEAEAAALLSCPISRIAPRVFSRRRRRVERRSRGFDRLTPRERHKLRIATKKLRYTNELFGSLFNEDDLRKFVGKLKRLQDDLGYANDVRVAHDFVTELFAQTDPRSLAAHAWIGVLEWHDQMLARGERRMRKHLGRLNRVTPFWRG
jgi:inorganic triphosphatase YgiF